MKQTSKLKWHKSKNKYLFESTPNMSDKVFCTYHDPISNQFPLEGFEILGHATSTYHKTRYIFHIKPNFFKKQRSSSSFLLTKSNNTCPK